MAASGGLWQDGVMPKNRKQTYSDHQSQAARKRKQAAKKKVPREDFSQAAARIVREATRG